MANSSNTIPHGVPGDPDASVATTPSATTAQGGSFSTGSYLAGILTGLATAGLLYLVSGKGKRSKASRSALHQPHDEPTLLPPSPSAVDGHDNDGCTAEEPVVNHHAPAGQRKLTSEDVETIRAMKDDGKPVKEIATLYGVSPKTIYARLRKQKSNEQNIETDGSAE